MAGFQAHITTSTVLGVGYGVAGLAIGMSPDKCLLAAGLCSVAGMLPDLDSDTGRPLREMMCFGSAVVPMMLFDRFEEIGLSHESIVLVSGIMYFFLRFGLGALFKKYTVHRGMFHSIPAAASVGLLTYLLCSCTQMDSRLFKSGAVVMGFMSHLVLDEIYSIDAKGMRLKKSFGTAIKFWGNKPWANFSVYAKLGLLSVLAVADPIAMDYFGYQDPGFAQFANKWSGMELLRNREHDHDHNEPADDQSEEPGEAPTKGFVPPTLTKSGDQNSFGKSDSEWVGIQPVTPPTIAAEPPNFRDPPVFNPSPPSTEIDGDVLR